VIFSLLWIARQAKKATIVGSCRRRERRAWSTNLEVAGKEHLVRCRFGEQRASHHGVPCRQHAKAEVDDVKDVLGLRGGVRDGTMGGRVPEEEECSLDVVVDARQLATCEMTHEAIGRKGDRGACSMPNTANQIAIPRSLGVQPYDPA